MKHECSRLEPTSEFKFNTTVLDSLLQEDHSQGGTSSSLSIIRALTATLHSVWAPIFIILIIFVLITRRWLILSGNRQNKAPTLAKASLSFGSFKIQNIHQVLLHLSVPRLPLTSDPLADLRNLLASGAVSGFFFRKALADTPSPASPSLSEEEPFTQKLDWIQERS